MEFGNLTVTSSVTSLLLGYPSLFPGLILLASHVRRAVLSHLINSPSAFSVLVNTHYPDLIHSLYTMLCTVAPSIMYTCQFLDRRVVTLTHGPKLEERSLLAVRDLTYPQQTGVSQQETRSTWRTFVAFLNLLTNSCVVQFRNRLCLLVIFSKCMVIIRRQQLLQLKQCRQIIRSPLNLSHRNEGSFLQKRCSKVAGYIVTGNVSRHTEAGFAVNVKNICQQLAYEERIKRSVTYCAWSVSSRTIPISVGYILQ